MYVKVRDVLKMFLDTLDPESDQDQRNFINIVRTAINEESHLYYEKSNLLEAILSNIVSTNEGGRISDPLNSMLLAMQIATWVNSASHVK